MLIEKIFSDKYRNLMKIAIESMIYLLFYYSIFNSDFLLFHVSITYIYPLLVILFFVRIMVLFKNHYQVYEYSFVAILFQTIFIIFSAQAVFISLLTFFMMLDAIFQMTE
ncbi:hypothetical protein [Jeotgalibacillus sp. JSM ZJ347]|uniref:hypothetical protein n=1 Tax=Jeotgalibacillus sp. JSM ZJ347 TaxID=3342117 RepID=UPI0035A8A834